MITAGEPMTHTFINLVPIKDQSNRLFMLLVGGRDRLKTISDDSFAAQTCFVENLTHDTSGVQFLSYKR